MPRYDVTGFLAVVVAPFHQPILWGLAGGLVLLLISGAFLTGPKISVLWFGPKFEVISPEAMQIAITTVLLGASLLVILSKSYDPTDKHWAYGTIGTMIGFWFRPASRAPKKTRSPKHTS